MTEDGLSLRWQQAMRPALDAVLIHPFLTGLSAGTLDPHVFAHFVLQDSHYLRDYAQALLVLGGRAPTAADGAMLARHASGAVEAELSLHAGLLDALGVAPGTTDATPVAPTTRAYTSYLLATVYRGDFVDGLAAVLPCYWIYAQVGRVLAERGSPDPVYQRWVDSYADPAFNAVVTEVLALVDRTGGGISPTQERSGRAHLLTTSRYEWMFWEAAYRQEAWPLPILEG